MSDATTFVPKSKMMRNSAVAALALAVVGGFEGLRQTAYPDPATRGPPWTICYGHTGGAKPWMHDSLEQCRTLLLKDLDVDAVRLEKCIHVDMPVTRKVAVLSLAINIGAGGVCGSSVVRDLNAGEVQRACDDFLKFNRAAGVVFPGLERRREQERSLCLE